MAQESSLGVLWAISMKDLAGGVGLRSTQHWEPEAGLKVSLTYTVSLRPAWDT